MPSTPYFDRCLSCGNGLDDHTKALCPSCKNARESAWRAEVPDHEHVRRSVNERFSDPRRTVTCPFCDRKFITEEAQRQHYADRHMVRVDV